jgi:dUTP pyrophosphatase
MEITKMLTVVEFKKLSSDAVLPQYKTKGAAAADVCSPVNFELAPGEIKLVKLGFACAVPEDHALLVCSRSGMALGGLIVANQPGIIDSDYRNEIGVILMNATGKPMDVQKGDRIAQLMLTPISVMGIREVKELDQTDRQGGFGSTGR